MQSVPVPMGDMQASHGNERLFACSNVPLCDYECTPLEAASHHVAATAQAAARARERIAQR